jgi:hypothetical protein
METVHLGEMYENIYQENVEIQNKWNFGQEKLYDLHEN